MCRSSTITIGSAAAILRLRPPEVEEADHHGEHRPAYGVIPVVVRVGDRMAVRAVEQVRLREMNPLRALRRVERLRAGLALALGFQQGVADQGDVERGRVELQ